MSDVAAAPRSPFVLSEAPTEPELVGKYFRALGDPTRVRILELLREHEELSVSELVDRLALSQPKVSNHLACLRWCGFLVTRREHPTVLYRIADDRVIELLALARALLAENAERVAACQRVDSRRC
jgi:ArsR family transcriptional regulator, cadmium/lead-responsive transcriptional repressor